MRYIFLIGFFISSLMAEKVTIGAGPYMKTQPYKNVDTIIVPSPVVFFDNSVFYVRWTRVGLYFLGDKKDDSAWGFSLTAQPRINNYKASDSSYLTGMSDKESSIEGGLAFSASIHKYYIEIMTLTDTLRNHDAWTINTEIGYNKLELGNFSFYPSILFNYRSSNFINYYYGVKSYEATASRAAYSAGNGLQIGVQTYIDYPINDKLSALVNIKADKLPSEATNSPIVSDDYVYSGLVSLIYTFEY